MCAACLVTQSCPTPWDSMDCSSPGSSVHGIFKARITGVGYHFLLQGIFPTQGSNLHLLCVLHWQADSSPLGSTGKPRALMGVGLRDYKDYKWRTRMKEGQKKRPHSILGPRSDKWGRGGSDREKPLVARAPYPATLGLTHSRLTVRL